MKTATTVSASPDWMRAGPDPNPKPSAAPKAPSAPPPAVEVQVRAVPASPRRYRSGLLVFLAYTLGAYAPLLLRQGSHSALWALAGSLSPLTWGMLVWRWEQVRVWLETARLPLVPLMLGLWSVTVLGLLAWCRAILLAGRDTRFVPQRLPGLLCNPRVASILGFVVPGIGQLASGHPMRAAGALWNAGWLAVAGFVLAHGDWLWRCNSEAGAQGVPGTALEMFFLAAAAAACIAAVAWCAVSLDGARLLGARSGRGGGVRADWLGFPLLASLLLAFLVIRPTQVARDLDERATAMQRAGLRVIPLGLELAAMHFDPAQPRYGMLVAELYEGVGKREAARDIRARLRERWEVYAEELLREETLSHYDLRLRRAGSAAPAGTKAPPGRKQDDRQ